MNNKYIDFVPSRGGSKLRATKDSTIIMPSRASSTVRVNRNSTRLVQSTKPKNTDDGIDSFVPLKKTTSTQLRKTEAVTKSQEMGTSLQPKRVEARVQPKKVQTQMQFRKISASHQVVTKKTGFANVADSPNNGTMKRTSMAPHRIMPTEQKNTGKVKLGVIEELSTGFVKSEVPKRPLGSAEMDGRQELSRIKARKLKGERKLIGKQNSKMIEKTVPEKKQEEKKSKYTLPKSPFINQTKVEKRPLSKNVYQQRVVESKTERLSGPVTIIEKPEKDSRISMVVIIILTIIIGAAAGTVAFLLLPR